MGTVGADAKFPQEWERQTQFELIRQGKGSWPTKEPGKSIALLIALYVLFIIVGVALLPISLPIAVIYMIVIGELEILHHANSACMQACFFKFCAKQSQD